MNNGVDYVKLTDISFDTISSAKEVFFAPTVQSPYTMGAPSKTQLGSGFPQSQPMFSPNSTPLQAQYIPQLNSYGSSPQQNYPVLQQPLYAFPSAQTVYNGSNNNYTQQRSQNGAQYPSYNNNHIQTQTKTVSQPKKKNYYNQRVKGSIPIDRSPIIGSQSTDIVEFDDYFEKHVDKFFSPELHEVFVYYTQDYLVGIQFIYRDSWGREDRETYKGDKHMSQSESLKNYYWSSMKFDFDDGLKEIYGGGSDFVSYLKLVSAKGKVIEFGKPTDLEMPNLIPSLTKCIGVGGSYGMCITNLYFYTT